MSAPQSLLGTGGGNVTCLSSGVFPSNAVTGPTIAATQPALGLNSSLSTYQLTNQMVPALTNHIVASTPPRLATSLNSSLSPATGISPLSPVLSLSPISPALGAQALGHSQQLATAAQPLQALRGGVGGVPVLAALLQSALLSPPPARRVLFHTPSLLTSSPSSLPLQHRPLMSAVPLQQPLPPAAVQVQPSLQSVWLQQQPQQPVYMYVQQQPQHPVLLQQQPQHPVLLQQQPQQPVLLQQQPQQPVLLQQQPQQPVLLQQQPQHPLLPQQQPQHPLLPQQQPQHPLLPQQQPQHPLLPQQQPQQPVYVQQQPTVQQQPQLVPVSYPSLLQPPVHLQQTPSALPLHQQVAMGSSPHIMTLAPGNHQVLAPSSGPMYVPGTRLM